MVSHPLRRRHRRRRCRRHCRRRHRRRRYHLRRRRCHEIELFSINLKFVSHTFTHLKTRVKSVKYRPRERSAETHFLRFSTFDFHHFIWIFFISSGFYVFDFREQFCHIAYYLEDIFIFTE